MKGKPNTSANAAELRRRAEALLRKQQQQQQKKKKKKKTAQPRTEADTQRLLHELQVHQIELEMQNAELQDARDEVEAGLEKYTDLYDFAPVGYFSKGGIHLTQVLPTCCAFSQRSAGMAMAMSKRPVA